MGGICKTWKQLLEGKRSTQSLTSGFDKTELSKEIALSSLMHGITGCCCWQEWVWSWELLLNKSGALPVRTESRQLAVREKQQIMAQGYLGGVSLTEVGSGCICIHAEDKLQPVLGEGLREQSPHVQL